jgi:CheY-like chemotaxis protein
MKLFLDDMEARIEGFVKMHGTKDVVITRTAQETIEALEKHKFDLVSLDHDLGGRQFQPSHEENCGMGVVRWILENKPEIKHIVVHSWNIPAAMRMAHQLYDAGYSVEMKPFGY